MVKKKLSGQTIAIIILAILLVLTIVFGAVFALYSTNSNLTSGKIVMANLRIVMESGNSGSDKSEIVISNGVNVVPGQPLLNTPLTVKNLSATNIYLIVVYEVNATKKDGAKVEDKYEKPVLGLGVEYINSIDPTKNDDTGVVNSDWIDYVFSGAQEEKIYRCLVSALNHARTEDASTGITVIGENKLSLSDDMGNEYQNVNISFTFQAYAIRSSDIDEEITNQMTPAERCEKIVSSIYEGQDHTFLRVDVTN